MKILVWWYVSQKLNCVILHQYYYFISQNYSIIKAKF